MSDTSLACPECSTDLHLEKIFIQIVKQDVATDIVDDQKDLHMPCPDCNNETHLEASEVITYLSANDNFLSALIAIAEAKKQQGRKTDLKKLVDRQRESLEEVFEAKRESEKRKEEIEEDLEDIRDKL